MIRCHIVVEDEDGTIVGQFDVSSSGRRQYIHDNIPDDLNIQNEQEISNDADLEESLQTLSDNVVEWDSRIEQL